MYKLEKLTYDFDSLEPYIDTHTLGLHKNKHQRGYLNRLNNLLIKNSYDFRYPIDELVYHLDMFNQDRDDILYNLGGVVNHDIYFKSMLPDKEEPNSILMRMIIERFNSYENFLSEFKKLALSIKGSGYVFLVVYQNRLELIVMRNQDTPSYYNLIPLIGLDMWEHAYYLNYSYYKDLYVDNFFEVLSFHEANKIINNI